MNKKKIDWEDVWVWMIAINIILIVVINTLQEKIIYDLEERIEILEQQQEVSK